MCLVLLGGLRAQHGAPGELYSSDCSSSIVKMTRHHCCFDLDLAVVCETQQWASSHCCYGRNSGNHITASEVVKYRLVVDESEEEFRFK